MISGPVRFCLHCGSQLTEQWHSGKMRPSCLQCGWVYFPDPKVAVAVVVKKNQHVLLVQRRFDPQKGHWTLPSGFVDAGEDPLEAAKRECLEETGLAIDGISLLEVLFSQEHPRGASILLIYQAEKYTGELQSGDDAVQAGFFSAEGLPPLAFVSTQQILTRYL